MHTRELEKIYREAKDIISASFERRISRRIENVVLKEKDLERKDEAYRLEYRVPAYFDANKRTVYYNHRILEKCNRDIVLNILVHELLHASSKHKFDNKKERFLKSGIRRQYLNRKKILFAGINEGFTQWLCNGIHKKSKAYDGEVEIVEKLIERNGQRVLRDEFFYDKGDFLEELAETIGVGTFLKLSEEVDRQNYGLAGKMIDKIMGWREKEIEQKLVKNHSHFLLEK